MGQPASSTQPGTAWPVLAAPGHWRVLDFISDLHLQAADAATFAAWRNYLESTSADAVFILGDLFEVWVGDDVVDSPPGQGPGFASLCQQTLRDASARLALFFMHGNRDFLLGPAFAQACGMCLLSDPTVLAFDRQRWLLTHGDALCLDDTDYQQFRTLVRNDTWCANFLAKPLAERQALARGLRERSESLKARGTAYADVDTDAAIAWLGTAQASTLIHGHTHRPADHWLDALATPPLRRLVLSDWDATPPLPRLEVLRLQWEQPVARINLANASGT